MTEILGLPQGSLQNPRELFPFRVFPFSSQFIIDEQTPVPQLVTAITNAGIPLDNSLTERLAESIEPPEDDITREGRRRSSRRPPGGRVGDIRWLLEPRAEPRTIVLKIVKYLGSAKDPADFIQATEEIYNQCNIHISSTDVQVDETNTHLDLNGNTSLGFPSWTHFRGEGEVNAVKQRAGATGPNQVPVAFVESIEWPHDHAGYSDSGLCAISNTAHQDHVLAHEVGHFFGLWHVEDNSRLMYGDANTTPDARELSPSECRGVRRRL
jgi:hypothetical protein